MFEKNEKIVKGTNKKESSKKKSETVKKVDEKKEVKK